jgi:L-alanine-DL-glutamate epimerase-like enolase superfamily enzyme
VAEIETVEVAAYTVPTDEPESDGTFAWDATTIVVVHVRAGGETGLGYTYAPAAVGGVIVAMLAGVVRGRDALAPQAAAAAMRAALRNAGQAGMGAMALSAVDLALHDVRARLLGLPLSRAVGAARSDVAVYGSGGFTSYSLERLCDQLGGWAADGIPRVKMKVGREPGRDLDRVRVARLAIGDDAELYVDANGAFSSERALRCADAYAAWGVTWFDEPVTSNDVDGLRLVRAKAPAGMEVAAGEYAYTPDGFRALLGAVDCLQADVTRCGGITGFLQAGSLSEAFELDLSGHTAPTIHAHVMCAIPKVRHVEWFHDHVRIERLLFDGFLEPAGGMLRPDRSRPGLGVEFRRADAERYAA